MRGCAAVQTVLIRVTQNGDGGYHVALRRRDAGGRWAETPLAVESVPADLRAMDVPEPVQGADVCKQIRDHVRDNSQSAAFDGIGEYLCGLVLCGSVHDRWDELRRTHQDDTGLRTLLQVEPDDLRLLPWELMSCGRRLFVDGRLPFARVKDRVKDIDDERDEYTLPIRLLVVVGELSGAPGAEAELRAIKRALARCGGRIDALFLVEPCRDDFPATYRRFRPHIFHFIGHGVRDPLSHEPALRILDRATGETWHLTRRDFRDLLKPAPRLAVLNACRSADGAAIEESEEVVSAVHDLVDALFMEGAAAVVGMQGDVRGGAAARFGGALYRGLVAEKAVDEAVAEARLAVLESLGANTQDREWFLPSLTLRVEPERVLPMVCTLSSDDRRHVHRTLTLKITPFVDRVDERRALANRIDPDPDVEPAEPSRLLVITGDMDAGKTQLVRWIRRRCAWRGLRAKYVDFGGASTVAFLEALRMIRATAEDVPSLGAHAAGAFRRFDYDVGFFLDGQLPAEPMGEVPLVELPPPPLVFTPGPVGLVERAFQSFLAALQAATATTPLVLILDHLDGLLPGDLQTMLYPHLISRIAGGEVPNLRLVVVLSTEQSRRLWPRESENEETRVPVDLIDPGRYAELFEDWVLALDSDMEPAFVQLRDTYAGWYANKPWQWANLRPADIANRAG